MDLFGTRRLNMSNDFWLEGKTAALSLTFDDARLSQVDQGLPLLDAYGVKATFYVLDSANAATAK